MSALKTIACGLSLILASSATGQGRDAQTAAFTIPAEEGYGIGDCLLAGSACGQALANSWCEAHGHLRVIAFGAPAATAETPGTPMPAEPASVSIRCGE